VADDPLRGTLLDLDKQLGGNASLCIGGGYGLYLKQLYLHEHPEVRTLFPLDVLPAARTTEDIDLFLRAEVVTDSTRMKRIREALDALGFKVVESAKFMQFVRPVAIGSVKVDLMVGPLGALSDRVEVDSRRVHPQPSVELHAHPVDEALGIEEGQVAIPLAGRLSSGEEHATTILVPQTFTYLLMKLVAFRDRVDDADKDLGRHHALDVYRTVGLLTEPENAVVCQLSEQYRNAPKVIEVRRIVQEYFADGTSLGMLRIREHPLGFAATALDRFREELASLFHTRE